MNFAERIAEVARLFQATTDTNLDVRIAQRDGNEAAIKAADEAHTKTVSEWYEARDKLRTDLAAHVGVTIDQLKGALQ